MAIGTAREGWYMHLEAKRMRVPYRRGDHFLRDLLHKCTGIGVKSLVVQQSLNAARFWAVNFFFFFSPVCRRAGWG